MIQKYSRLFRYRRSARRAAVSRELAEKYRKQTADILRRYPKPEPMPAGEWTREFTAHIATSLKGKARYALADVRALRDVIRHVR